MNNRFPILLLTGFCLTVLAQDDSVTAASSPTGMTVSVENSVQPSDSAVSAPESADPKKETAGEWVQEPLRDPFWPIGFFPQNWQKKANVQSVSDLGGAGWKAASAKIRISGTSRLGGRTAAIINGDLKIAGDPIEVLHEGKTYQWKIDGINAAGQIQLKRLGIR
ncbi:MAG: hypothetical protein HOO88_08275 [Kiritimatiellaceae bacterium]|nr:hypothetical protein [Kiritimatiellaceae bacterium]